MNNESIQNESESSQTADFSQLNLINQARQLLTDFGYKVFSPAEVAEMKAIKLMEVEQTNKLEEKIKTGSATATNTSFNSSNEGVGQDG